MHRDERGGLGLRRRLAQETAQLGTWCMEHAPTIIPFLLVCLTAHGLFHATSMYADYYTVAWWSERSPLDLAGLDHLTPCLTTLSCPEVGPNACSTQAGCSPRAALICQRLTEQLTVAASRAEYHFWLMRYFQIRYFGFIATAFLTGTLTAPFLVLTGMSGWQGLPAPAKSTFMGLLVCSGFFGSLPAVLKISDNIEENHALYIAHDNLSRSIRSFMLQGVSSDPRGPQQYLRTIDEDLAEINRVYLEFDAEKLDLGHTRVLEASGRQAPGSTETELTP